MPVFQDQTAIAGLADHPDIRALTECAIHGLNEWRSKIAGRAVFFHETEQGGARRSKCVRGAIKVMEFEPWNFNHIAAFRYFENLCLDSGACPRVAQRHMYGGGGWESNPPHAGNDASLVLKTREATRLQSPPHSVRLKAEVSDRKLNQVYVRC